MAVDLSGFVHKTTEITIGTKKFIFTELTLADMAVFKDHLNTERKKLNEDRRARLVADGKAIGGIEPVDLLKFTDSTMSEDEVNTQAGTIEGIGYLAYLSLKHRYLEISIEDAMKIVTPGNLDIVTDAMFPEIPESDESKKKLTTVPKKRKRNPYQKPRR